mgnify:CR=1 FL=1
MRWEVQQHSTDTHLTWDMSSSEKQFQTMTTRQEDAISQPMRFLFQMEQRAISANIQELFSANSRIAVTDPVYPVYVDSNVMAGRTGTYDAQKETWSNVIYMPSTADNGFVPELPKEVPDMIYLCLPNNPTGTTLTKEQLQVWVDYANKNGSVIIFDAAYEHISAKQMCHTQSMSVTGQRHVPSSLEASQRMQALQACVLASQ